jgi:TonB family protein
MIEHVREALRRKPLIGVVISILVHLGLLLALTGVHPTRPAAPKRGDALIVELPNPDDTASRGTPGPAAGAPLLPDPPAKAPAPRPAPTVRPSPPAPARPQTARPAPQPEPRQVPRAVATLPQAPPAAEHGDLPATKSAPQPEVAKPASEPPKPEAPEVASPPPSPPGQVAMAPPPPPDIRSALRRGGGGGGTGTGGAAGAGTGRGGIEGDPVALDSRDPDFSDYLQRVKALIYKHWVYPCVKNPETRECEYKSAQLVIEFGILKSGQLQFVELHRASGFPIMDEYAANAIKLASPFPAIPAALLQNRKGTGLPIVGRFNYVVETGLTNVIR